MCFFESCDQAVHDFDSSAFDNQAGMSQVTTCVKIEAEPPLHRCKL